MRGTKFNSYEHFRELAISYLGGKCNNCASTEDLEIDHIEPSKKSFNVSQRWTTPDSDEVWDELDKCQLLCKQCHVKKTSEYLSSIHRKEAHGTLNEYMRHKCRCEECRLNYSEWKKRKRQESNPNAVRREPYGRPAEHGEYLRYSRGCRCDLCREANRLRRRIQLEDGRSK